MAIPFVHRDNNLPAISVPEPTNMSNLSALQSDPGPEWRVEVLAQGRYYQWRKGRGKGRQTLYGGKFELLPKLRKDEYAKNVAKRHPKNGT